MNYLSDGFRAYTNIALIKYWGKKDTTWILPQNNSLSLTLDAFYTDTQVEFSEDFTADELWIDDQKQSTQSLKKAQTILNIVRAQAGIDLKAKISSINHVPTAAGLASSASGLAALAGAASDALHLNLSDTELSRLARRGSGSACRSIFGGFVEWKQGTDDKSSYAVPIDAADWDIAMLFIIVDSEKKEISSTEGMQHVVETSPYYEAWKNSTSHDLAAMKQAIQAQDFVKMGQLAEHSALKMHALNLSAQPAFNYWSPQSITAMNQVKALRKAGFSVYFTMDAGPNVKLLCKASEIDQIYEKLLASYQAPQLIKAYPGPGLQRIIERQVKSDESQ